MSTAELFDGFEERVVCADLRGYGDSAKPGDGPDHSTYSFRTMAADQVALMRRLGFDRFVDQFPKETAAILARFLGA